MGLLVLALYFTLCLVVVFVAAYFYRMKLSDGDWLVTAAISPPVLIVGYGAYSWVKTGEWRSFVVQDVLRFIPGGNVFSEQTGLVGLDRMSSTYLQSNVLWTLVIVPLVVWVAFSDRVFDSGESLAKRIKGDTDHKEDRPISKPESD